MANGIFEGLNQAIHSAGKPAPPPPGPVDLTPDHPMHPGNRPVAPLFFAGFQHGGINQLNDRVEAFHNAHVKAYGVRPSASLMFDVVRSPVPPQHYHELLTKTPRTPLQAQARAAMTSDRLENPHQYVVQNHVGLFQLDNPFRHMLQQVNGLPTTPEAKALVPPPPLAKRYPWVAEGYAPISNLGGVFSALAWMDKNAGDKHLQLLSQGQSLKQYQQELKAAEQAPAATPGHQAGMNVQQQLRNIRNPDYQARVQAFNSVTTVKQAQRELNPLMGTSLPETGFWNENWAKAFANWTKQPDYFVKSTERLAHNEGLTPAQYEQAWTNKQNLMRKHGLLADFIGALPTQVFVHKLGLGTFEDVFHYVSSGHDPWQTAFWSPTTALHGLSHSAGLALDTIGGTVQQLKADAAAGHEFMNAAVFYGDTLDEAKKRAAKVLAENPSWMRAFFPDMPAGKDQPGWLRKLDATTNLIGDLVLLRKASMTGERVAAGDLGAATKSTYLTTSSHYAFRDLVKYGQDGVGRAASRLENGRGAKLLVTRAEPLIRNGLMTEEQFQRHVAEMYATGQTTIERTVAESPAIQNQKVRQAIKQSVDTPTQWGAPPESAPLPPRPQSYTVEGPLLASLRTAKLTTPGAIRTQADVARHLRETADRLDRTLTASRMPGSDLANSFVNNLRAEVAHYTPGTSHYYEPTLPENVYNWTLKTFGDSGLANKTESQLVRAQAKENIPAIQAIQRKLEKLYYQKFPLGKDAPGPAFEATLATEAPSTFTLPGGGEQRINNALQGIAQGSKEFNGFLNKVAKLQARVILSGAPVPGGGLSLFWKHTFGDFLRRVAGGGYAPLSPTQKDAWRQIEALTRDNPALERELGVYLTRIRYGETRWMLGSQGAGRGVAEDFRTGEHFGDRNYMAAAGGKLRALLTDNAVNAYKATGSGDYAPLTDLILRDRTYRGMFKAAKQANPELTAEDYAHMVVLRFKAFEDAGRAAGIEDPIATAQQVYRANRASADEALGNWIAKEKVDWQLDSALVQQRGTFDDVTGRYVGNVIMKPNKWNREGFGRTVLGRNFAELTKAGIEPDIALRIAMDTGEKLTKYHMLDFANRLKAEQDFRWVSYFATKHRLYWKWMLGTFLRNPKYAALVNDFRQHLDERGNINFDLYGMKLAIPAARLVWVPGKDYTEFSPEAQLLTGLFKTPFEGWGALRKSLGSGATFTRDDEAILLGFKLAKIYAGAAPATYGAAVQGLTAQMKSRVQRALNEYSISYQHEHGHYPSEADAVKHVLLDQMGTEMWRSNLPLPVVQQGENFGAEQAKTREYMLLADPKKRSAFLHKNPDVAQLFGIYGDPKAYLHDRQISEQYQSAHDAYVAARAKLYEQVRATGHWTPQIEQQKRALDQNFTTFYNSLLVQDARFAGIDVPKGQVPDGVAIQYGPWAKKAKTDPAIDPFHALSALFPKLKSDQEANVIGATQKQLQYELQLLSNPAYQATFDTPEEVKTRKREILSQLDAFHSYPIDALGALKGKYQERVNSYWAQDTAWRKKISAAPHAEQPLMYSDYRAWRDSQDHPAVVNGVTFPSPLRMAWATKDPQSRFDNLAYLASKSWTGLTSYEKSMLLDKQVPSNLSQAYDALDRAKAEYRAAYPDARIDPAALRSLIGQIDHHYPGFKADYVNHVEQPRVANFEATVLYREMPGGARAEFDQYIGSPAKQAASAAASGGYSKNAIGQAWRAYVKQLQPWLADPQQRQLRQYLVPFGPDFLNEMITVG